jgi:hypothetical protein
MFLLVTYFHTYAGKKKCNLLNINSSGNREVVPGAKAMNYF